MSTSIPVIVKLLASSVSVAGRAGKIVRDVMSKGELGIVEKVCISSLKIVFECITLFYFINHVNLDSLLRLTG